VRCLVPLSTAVMAMNTTELGVDLAIVARDRVDPEDFAGPIQIQNACVGSSSVVVVEEWRVI
jgi:hypothetical protein